MKSAILLQVSFNLQIIVQSQGKAVVHKARMGLTNHFLHIHFYWSSKLQAWHWCATVFVCTFCAERCPSFSFQKAQRYDTGTWRNFSK